MANEIPDVSPAADLVDDPLLCVFGMCEMESAAQIIIKKAVAAGTWQVVFGLDDFPVSECNRIEQNGFLQLLIHGWLQPTICSKGSFQVTPGFIVRVNKPKRYDRQGRFIGTPS